MDKYIDKPYWQGPLLCVRLALHTAALLGIARWLCMTTDVHWSVSMLTMRMYVPVLVP